MRRTLIFSSLVLVSSVGLAAQATPPAAPRPASPRPAAPRPAVRAPGRPITLIIQVTDPLGSPLADTQVTIEGPVAREGATGADGSIRLLNMRAGTYRLRFSREGSVTLERDLAIRAGESPTVDVSLSAAPVAPEPPEPVKTVDESATTLAPPGAPKVTPVPLFLEKNFIGGREGRKESSLGCSATGKATLHQLREAWLNHVHEDADEWIYVVAGEGTLRIGTAETRIQAGTFSLAPHSTTHAIVPQGRNPLVIISVLSGPRCQM